MFVLMKHYAPEQYYILVLVVGTFFLRISNTKMFL